jgi:hypothetical protein
VLNTLLGGFGLMLVAPFTAAPGAWLLSGPSRPDREK